MDHRNARSGRTDDRAGRALFEDLDESLRNLPRFVAIARVESGLPATCLPVVKLHVTTSAPQHRDTARADVTPQLINQTRDEEGNLHLESKHHNTLHKTRQARFARQRSLHFIKRSITMSDQGLNTDLLLLD